MNQDQTSYDPTYFQALFATEEKHFWFRGRNWIIGLLACQICENLPDGFSAIEIGCGTGNVLRMLEPICAQGNLIGLDLHFQGLALARERVSCDLILGDIHAPPFTTGFDMIGLFDVIEHLPNDQAILEDVHHSLDVNGWMILSVPANPRLWSYFDVAAHHVRRYTKKGLMSVINEAGFEIKYISYTMMSLLPFLWLNRFFAGQKVPETPSELDQDPRVAQELRIIPFVNGLFSAFIWLEAQLIRMHIRLPIGSSLIAVAQKRVD